MLLKEMVGGELHVVHLGTVEQAAETGCAEFVVVIEFRSCDLRLLHTKNEVYRRLQKYLWCRKFTETYRFRIRNFF